MTNWGGLNNALAAWRRGLNELLPNRSTRSDGGYADSNHASTSQHQADADGTVDAFDEDRNYLGSADQDGNATEDKIHAALDRDFMADSRAYLIISDRTIRSDSIGNWRVRAYSGDSPHTEHTHRQVYQSREDDGRAWAFTHTRALLRQLNGDDDMTKAELLEVLESPAGQAAIAKAAGIGVHNQPLGRSGVTIGVQLQSTVGRIADDTTAIRAAVVPPPAE
jgi:hypothetical protein